MIDKYRDIPYIAGGRDLNGLDCWGLVRLVRIDMGRDDLPLFDSVNPLNKKLFTKSKESCVLDFGLAKTAVKEGAIACGFRGRLCYHVGIVIIANGRYMVLETDENTGVVLTGIERFKSNYSRVEFYD